MATGPPPSSPPASPNDVGLDESDLKDLCEELHKVNVKYYFIGLQILVEPDKIDCIEADYQHANERLREVLKVRLKQTPALTWADIIRALRSQMVDEPRLADSIEQGHCKSDSCTSDQRPEPVMHRKGKSAAMKRKFASHLHSCSGIGDTKRSKIYSEITEFDSSEKERIQKRKSRKPSKVSIPSSQKEQGEKKKGTPQNEAAVQDMPSPKSYQGDSESDSDGSSEDKEDRDSEQKSSNEEDETDVFTSAATSKHEGKKTFGKSTTDLKAKSLQKESEGGESGKGVGDESSSNSDDSSPEISMSLSENEVKKLKKIFGNFYGTLCYAIKDPVEIAALLQLKGLLSKTVMNDLLTSPESEQTKAITLVTALDKKIKPHPGRIFTIIEVFLQYDNLRKVGRQMWAKTGKWLLNTFLCLNRKDFFPLSTFRKSMS